MNFKNVIAQDAAKNLLRKLADNDRIPHALLLLGQEGVGGLPLAMAFAQYILCSNKTDGEPCGTCSHCLKADKMIHPDIHYSYPTIGSKTIATHVLKEWRAAFAENHYLNVNQWLEKLNAENKQGNIPVAECVEILKKLSLKTFEANYKILIMWLPEYLGKEGNRLLKMIEEPPDQTLFILVAENQDLILNTVLSRCQLIKLAPLNDSAITEALTLKGLTASDAEAIAHLADGNFNAAQNLAAETENIHATLFLDWMRTCFRGNGLDMVKWVENFAPIGRERQKIFLRYGLHFIRELMVLILTGHENLRLQGTELDTAKRMKTVIQFHHIEPIMALFNKCIASVERNANPKILFLDASIQMHKIMLKK
jgi:DNA polymerase-3 subunit delta'